MSLAVQAPRFALVGIAVTALHTVLATLLITVWGRHPVTANAIAFTAATLASYLANTLWTFGRRPHQRSLARFVGVSLAGLVLTVILSGSAEAMGLPFYVGLGAVVCVVPVASFVMHRRWTYRPG